MRSDVSSGARTPAHRLVFRVALPLIALTLGAGSAAARSKTDLVFLNNGDRITGEIKLLDRGILQLGTDDIGTIKIEWEDIDSLVSVYQFRVEDRDGAKYFGTITLAHAGHFHVLDPGARAEVPQEGTVFDDPERRRDHASRGLVLAAARRIHQSRIQLHQVQRIRPDHLGHQRAEADLDSAPRAGHELHRHIPGRRGDPEA